MRHKQEGGERREPVTYVFFFARWSFSLFLLVLKKILEANAGEEIKKGGSKVCLPVSRLLQGPCGEGGTPPRDQFKRETNMCTWGIVQRKRHR